MTKVQILAEIKRTAEANGGVPLGVDRFANETGLKEHDWQKYWPRWSQAVCEAGFSANTFDNGYDERELLEKYADLVIELGRLPTKGDLRVKDHSDPSFPSERVFQRRFGSKDQLLRRLIAFCHSDPVYHSVPGLCETYAGGKPFPEEQQSLSPKVVGTVYLAKCGRFYKIGKSNHAGRRDYELALQLPEKPTMIHVIETDDPTGVEAYWHNRFRSKRKGGEFFSLTPNDVAAFKRWRKIV
jgi:Meiotically Up-regulated Gene 113 (MUG113) protein